MWVIVQFFDSICRYVFVLCICVLFFPLYIVLMLFSFNKRMQLPLYASAIYYFSRVIIKGLQLNITMVGFDRVEEEPVLFVANHQSMLDTPLLSYALGSVPLVWLARNELEQSIILRMMLALCAVTIDVHSITHAAISLRYLMRLLHNSIAHGVIFPEGSRYADGEIHHFFNGFAFLAQATNRPVVPILIRGVNRVYPRKSFLIHRDHEIVMIKGPLFIKKESETIDQFTFRVKKWFFEKNCIYY